MRDLSPPEVMVPVSVLMCSDVRMSSLLLEDRPIHRKEIPLYLSLLDEVLDRWYTAVGGMNPIIYERYSEHTGIVRELQECLTKVADDDSSSVFDARVKLGEIMSRFDTLMDNLAEVFSHPKELKEFYYNISSRLKLTTECVLEGTYGW